MGETETLTFDRWQERANVWVRRNFPDSGASEQFLGIVEEVGELFAAIEARRDASITSDFLSLVTADEEIMDAIGDISIYLANYCNFRDIEISAQLRANGFDAWTIEEFQKSVFMQREFRAWLPSFPMWIGRLSRAQLKARQGIRGPEDEHRHAEIRATIEVLVTLAHFCNCLELDFSGIIAKTSDHVFARDWIANPTNGAAPCPDHT